MKYLEFAPSNREQDPNRNYLIIVLVIIVIGVAFFISDWNLSIHDNTAVTTDELVENVSTGSLARRVSYFLIGLLGIALLGWPSSRTNDYRNPTLFLFGCYLIICFASVIWSNAPQLTIRRLAILGFCVLGILGIVRHLSAQDLLHIALVIGILYVGVGLFTEITHQSFRPFEGNYRFSGTFHPNAQGSICATLVLAAFCSAREGGRGRSFYLTLFMISSLFLLLTKSRASLIGCCFALYAISFLKGSFNVKMFLVFTPPIILCMILLLPLFTGVEVTSVLERGIQLGRESSPSELGSLHGRIPLWTTLMNHILDRPLLGYGYHGFWTADRISEISGDYMWIIPNAHSVLIEVLLYVGFLGGAFYALGFISGFMRLARNSVITGTPPAYFAFSMILFALVSSIFESGFADPTGFYSFLTGALLMQTLITPTLRYPCVDPK